MLLWLVYTIMKNRDFRIVKWILPTPVGNRSSNCKLKKETKNYCVAIGLYVYLGGLGLAVVVVVVVVVVVFFVFVFVFLSSCVLLQLLLCRFFGF